MITKTIIVSCAGGGDDESPWSLQPKAEERLWGVRAGRGEEKKRGKKGEGKMGNLWKRNGKTEEQGSEDSGHSSLGLVPSDVFY